MHKLAGHIPKSVKNQHIKEAKIILVAQSNSKESLNEKQRPISSIKRLSKSLQLDLW